MSHIFDALQRSEVETSGVDAPDLLEATELLKRAERRAAAQWESEVRAVRQTGEPASAVEIFSSIPEPLPAPVVELPIEIPYPQVGRRETPFPSFQSFSVAVAATNRLVAFSDGNSVAAEAFRLLSVRLRHLSRERALHKLLVTSTIPREGKSMVTGNLASTLATRQKTLLIEGDVRRPSLSQLFGFDKHRGLCDLLRGQCETEGSIYHFAGLGFWFMPAGNALGNPLELLQSSKLSALMEQLSGWFDWIVIDSPPVLPLADTSIWARLADGILLVARQGTTEKKQLTKGLGTLEPRKIIGALLNGSKAPTDHGYYYTRPADRPQDEDLA
jgi:capsular exopolysaccharide synthesis family protein